MKIEANAELTVMKGLGREWRWADLIHADRAQMNYLIIMTFTHLQSKKLPSTPCLFHGRD